MQQILPVIFNTELSDIFKQISLLLTDKALLN
jgi:hypothetical protein